MPKFWGRGLLTISDYEKHQHCVDAISSLDYGSDDEWDRAIRATMYAMTVLKNLTIPVSEEWGNPR